MGIGKISSKKMERAIIRAALFGIGFWIAGWLALGGDLFDLGRLESFKVVFFGIIFGSFLMDLLVE